MWVFLSRRLRRWLIMAVAVPVIGALARRLSGRLEETHPRSSKALGHVGRVAQSPKQRQRQSSR
jgi:hypothetical protein